MLILTRVVLSIHDLDWWNHKPGRTSGISELMKIANNLKQRMAKEFGINARSLPDSVENGGILLKETAVLVGLGVIGRNNILNTPEYGQQNRLRGLFIDMPLESTSLNKFDPCNGCADPRLLACPQNVFGSSSYSRD